MENKCKVKDLIYDLISVYGVMEISMDISGVGYAVADALGQSGVKVKKVIRTHGGYREVK